MFLNPVRRLAKALVIGIALYSGAGDVFAAPPGEVRFSNYAFAMLDAPFFDNFGQRLSGTNYLVELYAGVDPDSLFGIGPLATFSTGSTAGYFDGGVVLLPAGVTGGGCGPAWVQVRAWAAVGGATFEQAALAGYWTGVSSTIYLPYTGGCGAGVPGAAVPLLGLEYPGPPIILQQPTDRDITSTGVVQLWVVASGGVTLTYQWYWGFSGDTSAPIPGATNAFYQAPTTNGSYWVRVSTSAGQTDSRTASVWIVPLELGSLSLNLVADLPSLTFSGETGTTVQVQFSSDLAPSHWKALTNVFQKQSPTTVIDSTATNAPARFYRLAFP